MEGFLPQVVCLLLFIVLFGLLNERVLHLTYEIALMLSATCAGVILLLGTAFMSDTPIQKVLAHLHPINIESFLLDGALCFMLFAGSCHIRINDFKTQARAVSVLAIITTILGALFYGLCFYGAALLFNLPFSLPVCLLFGSIIAPTDPIAATSILCNFGLPHRTRFLIEGESLLNDGVGVALFSL